MRRWKTTSVLLSMFSVFLMQDAVAADCPYDVVKKSMDKDEYEQMCAEHAELMQAMDDSAKRADRGEAPPGGYMCRDVLTHCRGAWNKPSHKMWGKPDYWARTDDLTGKSWQQVSWSTDSRIGRNAEFGIQCNTSGVTLAYASFSGYMSKGPGAKIAIRIGDFMFSELRAEASGDGLTYTMSDETQVASMIEALRNTVPSGEIVARGWDYNDVASTLKFEVGSASEALQWLPCLND